MGIEVTHGAVEFAQYLKGLKLRFLALQARGDILDFFPQSGGGSCLPVGSGQHGQVRIGLG